MKVDSLKVPYFINKVEEHSDFKQKFLNLFDEVGVGSVGNKYMSLVNTSYPQYIPYPNNKYDGNKDDEWVVMFLKLINKYRNEVLDYLNHGIVEQSTPWFHQYEEGDTLPWHSHGGYNYSMVYYLELPENRCKLQFLNVLDNSSEIKDIDVKEGDLVIFPSSIVHRSPKNDLNRRMTILAGNYTSTLNN